MNDCAPPTLPTSVNAPVGWICSTFWTFLFETNRPPRLARMSVAMTTPSSVAMPMVVVPVLLTVSSSSPAWLPFGSDPSSGSYGDGSAPCVRLFIVFLHVDLRDDRLEAVLRDRTERFIVSRDRRNVDIFGGDDFLFGFAERAHGEFDAAIHVEIGLVVILEIALNDVTVAADGGRLPLVVRPRGVGLEQFRLAVLDPADEQCDAERARATGLRIL